MLETGVRKAQRAGGASELQTVNTPQGEKRQRVIPRSQEERDGTGGGTGKRVKNIKLKKRRSDTGRNFNKITHKKETKETESKKNSIRQPKKWISCLFSTGAEL